MTLTDGEWSRIARAPRCAAHTYAGCVQEMRVAKQPRLMDQFEAQRLQAIVLAARIEEEVGV